MMREKAVTFGPHRSLVGILTPAATADSEQPHVVLLNSGIIHRVGASRLHVTLARAFADLGFTTLRFDLSGIGDSASRDEPLPLPEIAARDIDDALAYLREHHHADRFVMMGLCSGAQDAFATAVRRQDVVGLALLDLPGPFRNWQHYAYHFGRRMLRGESWRNTFTGRNAVLRRIGRALRRSDDTVPAPLTTDRPEPPRAVMEQQFLHVLKRDVPTVVVFTGTEDVYNHRSQFKEVFPAVAGHPLISYDFFRDADHLFSGAAQREALVSLLRRWMAAAIFPRHPRVET